MTCNIFRSLTLVKVHARCRGGALGLAIATVVYRIESKGAALSTEESPTDTAPHCDRWPPFRRAYFSLARRAARLGDMARDGGYDAGGALLGWVSFLALNGS